MFDKPREMCYILRYTLIYHISRSGGIGRHAALRGLWEKSRRGSSPLFGTKKGSNYTLKSH